MTTVAQAIAKWLVDQGVRQVFAVTGGGAMFLNQALGSHPELQCTYMHHEQACAMAAEGYARISGKPAVVMLTTGPGALNAVNGVFGAYTDSIPMIVLSGQVKSTTSLDFHDLPGLRQLGDQEGPTVKVVSSICKYAKLVRSAEDVRALLPDAYFTALSGRPGPVWLDIPLDIQGAEFQGAIPSLSLEVNSHANSELVMSCQQVLRKLQAAQRPLILAGTGVRLSGATDALRELTEQLGVPIQTAWTHDLIESEHPLFAGRPGTIGTRAGNLLIQAADFVLVLGSRLNIRQTSYNFDNFAKNAYRVQVDIDVNELQKPGAIIDLPIESDVRVFIETLQSLVLDNDLPDFSAWQQTVLKVRERFSVQTEYISNTHSALCPYVAIAELLNGLREDDIIVCGNASACIIPFQIAKLGRANRMFSNSGSASMGYDLPAAIGAAIAAPERRVICFAGDGSLQMNIQELQTLASLQVNIILVVINNQGYASIRQTHENFFNRVIGANPSSGVEFPAFQKVAQAYQINAIDIHTLDELKNAQDLLLQGGPLLVDLHVDSKHEFKPRIKSRVDETGTFISPELDDMYPFLDVEELNFWRAIALNTDLDKGESFK